MKTLHCFGCLTVVATLLSACGGGGSQALLAASPSSSQDAGQSSISPMTSKKHIGSYWWIWLSVKIPAGKKKTLLVYCPQNYVVTGGGFSESGSESPYTYASKPILPKLNGWEVVASDANCPPSGCNWSGVETAFGVCAPISR